MLNHDGHHQSKDVIVNIIIHNIGRINNILNY